MRSAITIAALLVLGSCVAHPALATINRTLRVDEGHRQRSTGPILILLHGYGSAPETFLGLTERTDLPIGTRLILPRGPNAMPHGASWWPLPSEIARVSRERLPGMDAARDEVSALLDRVARAMPSRPIILGGFSQGAMVSLDVALHDSTRLAGLVLMSGTMIDVPDTLAHLESRRGLRVYLSHGREDAVVPFAPDVQLSEAMRAHGLDVSFSPFEGGHEVTPQVSSEVAAFIRRCASRS